MQPAEPHETSAAGAPVTEQDRLILSVIDRAGLHITEH